MAVTSVSVGPALRAWMDSGLTHILLEGTVTGFEAAATADLRKSDVGAAFAPSPLAGKPALTAKGPDFSGPSPSDPETLGVTSSNVNPLRACSSDMVSADTGSLTPLSARADFSEAGSSDAGTQTRATVSFSSDHFSLPPGEWPEPWRAWFAKITAAPVLWTYHELGADLTGIGRSQERSVFFKNLIAELGLPKGSSVFWPSAMPVSSDEPLLVPYASLFTAGLRLLMPRAVVVLGDTALEDIGFKGTVGQFGQVMVEGKLLVRLPGIEELLRGDAQRSSAVSLLRALFVSINLGK